MKSDCWIKACEMAKKTLLSPPSKVQLVSLYKKYKSLTAERGRDDYLFLDDLPKIFFRLPNLKKMIFLGGRSGSCVPGDKKANSGSYGALDATMTYLTLCRSSYRM